IGYVDLVGFGIDLRVGSAAKPGHIIAIGLRSEFSDLQYKLSHSGEFQILPVIVAIAADPHETSGVDADAMLVLWPFVALTGAAPGPDQIAFGVEFHHRWCGPAAFRLRRIKCQRLLVGGKRARALNNPDMVLGIDRDAGRLSYDPVVRQWLGPCRIDLKAGNVIS